MVAQGGHWEWEKIVMPAIHQHFPDAYMTSGSFSGDFSDFNDFSYIGNMDITIALER